MACWSGHVAAALHSCDGRGTYQSRRQARVICQEIEFVFLRTPQLSDHILVFLSQRVTGVINVVLTLALSLNYTFWSFLFENACVRLGRNALINLYANSP